MGPEPSGRQREQDDLGAAGVEGDPLNAEVRGSQAAIDLTQDTAIWEVRSILEQGIDQTLCQKYLVPNLENPWEFGMLLDPEGRLAERFGLPQEQAQSSVLRTNDAVRELLRTARANHWPLEVEVKLRGIDGPGSSQDLIRFQVKMTVAGREMSWMYDMPCTTAFASSFQAKFSIEAPDPGEEDQLVYIAPDYFEGKHVRTVSAAAADQAALRREFNNEWGLVENRDLPAFSLANYFGITRGVKIICHGLSSLPKEGGMESSNAFSTAIYAIGSMLSGADWSWGRIIKQAVQDENTIYGHKVPNITGGQGHISSTFGGMTTIEWLSGLGGRGMLDDESYVYDNGTYAAMLVPLNIADASRLKGRLFLLQPGKDYEPGGKAKGRLAFDTNFEWTEEWREPVGQQLHMLKKALHYIYKRGLEEGDDRAVGYALNKYSEIRLALNARYKEWHGAVTGEQAAGGIGYMDEHSQRVFDAIRQIPGAGFMPAGAGGPGSVCIAYLPEGVAAAEFFEGLGIREFDEERARKVKQEGGTLSGYIPFEPSDQPMTFSDGWRQLGIKMPAGPRLVAVNQRTGEVLTLDGYAALTEQALPEPVAALPPAARSGQPVAITAAKAAVSAMARMAA